MTNKMCRCCLTTDDQTLLISLNCKSPHDDQKTLDDYLNTLCNFAHHSEMEYPGDICLRCCKALQVSYHFVLMTFKSKWKLEEIGRIRRTVFGMTTGEDCSGPMGNPIKMESNDDVVPIQVNIMQMDKETYKVTMEGIEGKAIETEVKSACAKAEDMNWNELIAAGVEDDSTVEGCHKCRYCPETSDSNEALIQHALKEHKYLIPFKCKICTYATCNLESLTKHYRGSHQLENVEERLYQTKELLAISSEDVPKNATTFKCNICEFQCYPLVEMDDHMAQQHHMQEEKDSFITKYYNCPECYRQFVDETAAKIHHTMSHNMQQSNKNSIFTCQKCAKTFDLKASLMAHERFCEMRDPVICNFCHQKFSSVLKYEQHIQSAHAVAIKYECEICEKSFKSSATLTAHRKRHNERHYQCELCPKNYINHAELRVHKQRIHKMHASEIVSKADGARKKVMATSKRPTVQCEYCEFTSTSKFAMEVHMYKHTGRPYKCKFCHKQFVLKKAIKQHCLRLHNFEITDNELAIMFKEKHGYPSRFDTFAERNNNLHIEEIDFMDLEVELQAFNLTLDDIMQDVFVSNKVE